MNYRLQLRAKPEQLVPIGSPSYGMACIYNQLDLLQNLSSLTGIYP
jgi:hypothetical protein